MLSERKSRGVMHMIKEGTPFYTMFAVGDFTFAVFNEMRTRMAGTEATVVIKKIANQLFLRRL